MAGTFTSPEVAEVATLARSYGYTVITRHPRVWCLCPYEDIIYLAKKLARRGYWQLHQIDGQMWTTWGAMGKPLHEYILHSDLLTFLYDEAYKQTQANEGDIEALKSKRPFLYEARKGNIVTIEDIRSGKYKGAALEGKVINRAGRKR